ncbi:acyl-CoA thioesterase [Amycolatopsis sp.]|uniref:acyl-CoA thioesterase n=1 Tax=Amycolatopsis sp. TaxID=37632 RepID=UPI002CF5A642|nr:acyl-CoA thioesterase domain-containing protein [Amycolatopsis sp.]HVV08064.1 acyl-CoA thioesterase domain-containing protein [Amycolatopsis sp.]
MASLNQAATPVAGPGSVLGLLELERVEQDLYRAAPSADEPYPLYGGQIAAQALKAAGLTVAEERAPHSLHGYFLRGGATAKPTIYRVDRDRDGRSYSARRVVAIQDGKPIFTLSASFVAPEPGADREFGGAPAVPPADELGEALLPRLLSIEARLPPQEHEDAEWPTRFWARCTAALPESPLVHACVLTYLSDISSGLFPLHGNDGVTGASLDHALWFHRPVRLDEWVLTDLVPQTVAGGRGWYTGTVRRADGTLAASLTQEALFRGPDTRPDWARGPYGKEAR